MAKKFLHDTDFAGNRAFGLPTPTQPDDAANKAYVDSSGLPVAPRVLSGRWRMEAMPPANTYPTPDPGTVHPLMGVDPTTGRDDPTRCHAFAFSTTDMDGNVWTPEDLTNVFTAAQEEGVATWHWESESLGETLPIQDNPFSDISASDFVLTTSSANHDPVIELPNPGTTITLFPVNTRHEMFLSIDDGGQPTWLPTTDILPDPNAVGSVLVYEEGGLYWHDMFGLDYLYDVAVPNNTPAGKVLGTTAVGTWGPVDPPGGLPPLFYEGGPWSYVAGGSESPDTGTFTADDPVNPTVLHFHEEAANYDSSFPFFDLKAGMQFVLDDGTGVNGGLYTLTADVSANNAYDLSVTASPSSDPLTDLGPNVRISYNVAEGSILTNVGGDPAWRPGAGGGGTDEVYIGPDEPMDPDVTVWINPAAQGGGTGGGGNYLPLTGGTVATSTTKLVVGIGEASIKTLNEANQVGIVDKQGDGVFTTVVYGDYVELAGFAIVLAGPTFVAPDDTWPQPPDPSEYPALVASRGYVDDRIWKGTQAAYDALQTKDPNVLYVVTG